MVSKLLATVLMMAVCFQGIESNLIVQKGNDDNEKCLLFTFGTFDKVLKVPFTWKKDKEEFSETIYLKREANYAYVEFTKPEGPERYEISAEPNGRTLTVEDRAKQIVVYIMKNSDGKTVHVICLSRKRRIENDEEKEELDKYCKNVKHTINQTNF